MLSFVNVRNERIYKLEKKLERTSEKLTRKFSFSDLSHFLKLERELQIQKAYKEHEMKEAALAWHDELLEEAAKRMFDKQNL